MKQRYVTLKASTDPAVPSDESSHKPRPFLQLPQVQDADAIRGLARTWKASKA